MPDKPLTVAAYAAGASLAAATLVYVFGPTFFIDGDLDDSGSSRKKGVVGLYNPANDCFINSVLQTLAGLADLRIYLIREIHRRKLDGNIVYRVDSEGQNKSRIERRKQESLLQGVVTSALKEVLDNLNERPLYKKTISAGTFISALEQAFDSRISRQQQDAQEFLQVVAERLSDEYHAGRAARARVRTLIEKGASQHDDDEKAFPEAEKDPQRLGEEVVEDEEGFPLEGCLESQIECLTCHFQPKPSKSTFVTLTLHVPMKSSTSLDECFDSLFKTEYIEDFKCEKCRLQHAFDCLARNAASATGTAREAMEQDMNKLERAIQEDPEIPPEGVILPDAKYAPKRRIARHTRIVAFPKIMAIHLSRSIFDPMSVSTKNAAKVTFPERLPIGSLLRSKKYTLLGMITHKGSHNSGHYESFRRQTMVTPFSTPLGHNPSGPYSPLPTPAQSRPISPHSVDQRKSLQEQNPESSAELENNQHSRSSPLSSASQSSIPSSLDSPSGHSRKKRSISSSRNRISRVARNSMESARSSSRKTVKPEESRLKKKKKTSDRWWRISDDKVKEGKTRDVLSMQKEVYMLFYEIERDDDT
ncbi:cysteine proteinase [Xylona heveae TC161]|uniref:Ubiquitin carboxyl-terminal hydrolase n=1 Tax=Xylona heveae (strain CBS 132557 / TC161) TaxID=1328760 RepID=A0A165FM63_XYLHT|nr:cysteine proteinase [Xylona heveae TC161]KZF21144.1 cysteine proteinase [Xylona heveae TC161]